ncbi:MAG: PAS domain-containing protein, partial [Burkholderiales bacterium]|nr:PAS domain-containing protein [Burkholderiales bacterium]
MGEADESLQALLRFLYRAPIAVVQALRDGTIEMMTPLAANWLLPMAADRTRLDNLFDLLDRFDPGLRGLAAADSGAQAALCEGRLVSVADEGRSPTLYALDMVALDRSRVMVLLNDVTRQEQRAEADRRMTRQHLADLAALSEQALDTMAVAVAREFPGVGPVRLDARWRHWLGLPADCDSLSPAELAARVHPDDRPAYEREHARAAAGQQSGFSDFRLRRGDGSWASISGRRYLALDAAGAGQRLNTFAFDVTEQRAAERERLALAEKLHLAAVATGIASFEWRRRERELLWSGPGRAVFGRAGPGPEGAARWLERALPPTQRARLVAWLRGMLRRRSGGDLEFEIIRPDGSRHWLAVKAQPRLDNRGAVGSLIGVVWDVSERRAGEAALEARHQAEQANRAKSEFLSRMSHELRTPLNAILGFSEVMLRSPEIGALPRQKHRLDQIHDAGRHLLQLIDDLLDVSRIEIGALQLELASVDLAECARAACLAVQQQARLRRVTITIEPPPRPAHVRADPTRLRQVLLNLLSNAVKYNREQGRVELRFEPTEHGWL